MGVEIDLKTVFILTYGCDLDHSNIDFLVNERLLPFKKYYNKPNKRISNNPEIKLVYDVYDVNRKKHIENKYFLEEFYITETQLKAFEYSLSKLKGNTVRCNPSIRGHYFLRISGIEYSARNYHSLEKTELIFLDEEEVNNKRLRKLLNTLPEEMQWLEVSLGKNFEEREQMVNNWIKTLLSKIIEQKNQKNYFKL